MYYFFGGLDAVIRRNSVPPETAGFCDGFRGAPYARPS